MARVSDVNTDKGGVVRDVKVRTFPSYPVPVKKANNRGMKGLSDKIPATTLHRDVRRLVILIPVEEQK